MDISIINQDMKEIYERNYDWNKLRGTAILVTGAYGMLASYIVKFLAYLNDVHNMNITIICQGRNKDKMEARFFDLIGRDYFHQEYFSLNKNIKVDYEIDYIIHTASLANPACYLSNPVEVEEPNAIGTYFLLLLAKELHVDGFLFFSTCDIYGKVDASIDSITEDTVGKVDPLDAHSCYGESKRMGETWCASFAREYGVPAKIARIGHTYGATMDVEHDPRVFASFLKNVIDGNDIEMLSDGRAKRPFCYISDATAAFFLVLLEGNSGEAYNVCNTNQFISIKELADIMVGLRPEKKLKVIRKTRNDEKEYLEASFNICNCPVENKLLDLGWDYKVTTVEGFDRVLKIMGY